MTKSQSIESIEKATGRSWKEWNKFFSDHSAKELDHKSIASLVHKELEGKIDSAGWWSQAITVAYEQYIGRREPGQKSDGTYEVSVSKTVEGTRDEVYASYAEKLSQTEQFNNLTTDNERTSTTPVRSYWKCDFSDGSKIIWSFEQKNPGKVLLVAMHTGLASSESAVKWRDFWKEYLG